MDKLDVFIRNFATPEFLLMVFVSIFIFWNYYNDWCLPPPTSLFPPSLPFLPSSCPFTKAAVKWELWIPQERTRLIVQPMPLHATARQRDERRESTAEST
jgi:hypothetical protein